MHNGSTSSVIPELGRYDYVHAPASEPIPAKTDEDDALTDALTMRHRAEGRVCPECSDYWNDDPEYGLASTCEHNRHPVPASQFVPLPSPKEWEWEAADVIVKVIDKWLEKLNLPTSNKEGKELFRQTMHDIARSTYNKHASSVLQAEKDKWKKKIEAERDAAEELSSQIGGEAKVITQYHARKLDDLLKQFSEK